MQTVILAKTMAIRIRWMLKLHWHWWWHIYPPSAWCIIIDYQNYMGNFQWKKSTQFDCIFGKIAACAIEAVTLPFHTELVCVLMSLSTSYLHMHLILPTHTYILTAYLVSMKTNGTVRQLPLPISLFSTTLTDAYCINYRPSDLYLYNIIIILTLWILILTWSLSQDKQQHAVAELNKTTSKSQYDMEKVV